MKKLSCLLSMVIVGSLCLTSCSLRDKEQSFQIDKTKTQLYVGLGTNGLSGWMDKEKELFEKMYEDVSFEEGKKGVELFYSYNEKFSNFSTLPLNYTKYQEKLIITESVSYQVVKSMALDITDIITTPINQKNSSRVNNETDTTSIENKILFDLDKYYKADGHYYGVPAQESPIGLIYDVDLFNEYGLYFANDETENYYEYECDNAYTKQKTKYKFVDGDWTKDDLSKGPDGKSGTFDDGFASTYEEFFALCDYMKKDCGIEPIRWAGKVQAYMTDLLNSLAADYEGNEYLLKTSFNGMASDLIRFDDKGSMVFLENGTPETYAEEICAENGYKLTDQAGYYYALKFLETLIGSNYYDKDLCFSGAASHLDAQSKYLLSKKLNNPIAMLVDGSWWQGEASLTFNDMAKKYGEKWSVEKRNFGYMPLPKATKEKVGQQQSTHMTLDSVVMITNDATGVTKELCELFLKHIFSKDSLYNFTLTTGQMRPYTLDLSDQEFDQLTGFGKSSYNLHSFTNLKFMPSNSSVYLTNHGLFYSTANFHWQSNLGSVPTEILRSGDNAKKIFEKVHEYWTKDKWDSYFKGICY